MQYNRISLLLVCFMLGLQFSIGQTENNPQELQGEVGDMVVSISPSFTWVPEGAGLDNLDEKGHFTPGMGIDFFYRFHPRWEIGAMADIEFDHYLIPRKDDLERERAFVFTGMVAYTLGKRWNLFAGGGVEMEKHEWLPVGRFGIEYVVPMQNGWFLPIGGFVDFKPGYQAYSTMIGIGKSFK